ncbi:gluconeogenesis factor YvcK family protein [Brunnivagina elsteri]|uniref:Putative gluconeogenesis factor n=1 Tax=Brunnivagina elsteri CCALA 953 TaxID=987040 RepID=A0A2A2TPJ7_9CYAN|nr:gluconeogenesis factor YvcK family protein [Calothrix elsteri]PAX60446.1 hypothetical protein CK510_01790 [Calothrix elsteri CCALA 953]
MSIGFIKQALNSLQRQSRRHTPHRISQWFKWLSPGLAIKRWLIISLGGMVLGFLGLAIWIRLTPIFWATLLIRNFLGKITDTVPYYISGPFVMVLGLLLLVWGQTRTVSSITEVIRPNADEELVDVLLAHRRLYRGPKIVVIGGGTGLSNLLRGLKTYSANITAIVTVADDGGSSGRLRQEFGVLPPGDIRNCLAALADEEKLLTELFQYRFSVGDGLSGHSFGNLFLTALSEITGDLERAVAASSKVLAIRGQVLPATLSDVRLWAKLADGRRIEGESSISKAGGSIVDMGCTPANPPALPAAIKAIQEADYIIMGPGSLYTSVIPNLIVPQIADAIAATDAPRIYICNIMTQPGETEGYSVAEHIQAIDKVCGRALFNAVLVHKTSPSARALIRYSQSNSHPVFLDREDVTKLGRRIVLANVMHEDEDGCVKHDSEKLAKVLVRWYTGAKV